MILSKERKKEVIAQYKERKSPIGIYAIRCNGTGEVWVGHSRNLDATRNSVWFSLRIAAHRDKRLQEEWNQHGEVAFEYEVLETLKDDVASLLIPDLLKHAKQRWMWERSAHGLL